MNGPEENGMNPLLEIALTVLKEVGPEITRRVAGPPADALGNALGKKMADAFNGKAGDSVGVDLGRLDEVTAEIRRLNELLARENSERPGAMDTSEPFVPEVINPDGSRAKYERRDGKLHGQGVKTMDDGDTLYKGKWHDGKPYGRGVLEYGGGSWTLEGEWRDGELHGPTVLKYIDGTHIKIEYRDGKPHGCEVYEFLNGMRYEVECRDGKVLLGKGVITWPDGRRYEGEVNFEDEYPKPHGQGVMTLPGGKRHEGGWREGELHGKGVVTLPDGKRYECEWHEGKLHGKVVVTLPDGQRYEVEFCDGEVVSDSRAL